MPDDLYDRDILLWSERQAALLRQLAQGERLNEQVDWEHVIEEVEDVGASELRAVRNALRQALIHLMKLADEGGYPTERWRLEVSNFLADAQGGFAPSMKGRIEVDEIYRKARRQLQAARGRERQLAAPEDCPYAIEDLLDDAFDLDALIAKLR